MPRRVEDIKPSDRRSIRSVPVEKVVAPAPRVNRIKVTPPPPVQPPRNRTRKPAGVSRKKVGLLAVLAVIVLVGATAYVASTSFSRASFTIHPVTIPVAVNNQTIVATGTSTPGYLRYDIVKYTGAASTTIPAADGSYVSTKASGTVTLFNTYNTQGQRLIAGTRFANEYGSVYRLSSSVFIPGYTSSGLGMTPGTVKATLVADEAGSQYNMARNEGGAEFRVIAYKGGPRYDAVYAKAYAGMGGGFAGAKKIVNQVLLASTTQQIQGVLTQSLAARAAAAVPEGYVTYPAAYGTAFAPTDVGGTDPKKAVVTVSGTFYSIIFRKTDLAAKLAGQETVDRFGKSAYSILGLENLKFAITNPSTFKAAKMNTLIARLSGPITLKGVVPVADLTHKLAGLPLAETRPVFASYSSVIDVARSSGELFPSWAAAVPKDEKRITVKLEE